MVEMGIGYFGDDRRRKVGELLIERMTERQEVCIRKLGDDRPEQVRFRRFLYNDAVTVEEMVAHRGRFVAAAARGRHVLAIQDTSEINYQSQSGRKQGLGTVGNGSDVGLFVHPVLAVDAESGECLGLVNAQVWRRTKAKAADYKKLPIEEKESYRWLYGADQAKAVLSEACLVTVVDDREGDIYEKWARLPDTRTHLLTRACRDRSLVGGGRLFATMAAFAEVHRYEVDLPARPNKKRSAHKAELAVRIGCVRIRRSGNCSDPGAPAEIELFAIEVREVNAVPGEEPILCRLPFSLTANDLLDDNRPTLTLTYPRAGANPALTSILVGMHDYYSGLDMESFQVVADLPVNGKAAGDNLAAMLKPTADGVWELALATPLTNLAKGKLTVSVKDRQGNTSRIERTFSVSK